MPRSAATSRGRDVAYATCLAFVLGVGILGVLLLNTAMQQQSRVISATQHRLAVLAERTQQLTTSLHVAADPQQLADRARQLHLRPVKRVTYLNLSRPGAGRVRAG